ncbi:MAG: hypothetical protein AAGF73_19165, partial [Actinomycetota bacterium]
GGPPPPTPAPCRPTPPYGRQGSPPHGNLINELHEEEWRPLQPVSRATYSSAPTSADLSVVVSGHNTL